MTLLHVKCRLEEVQKKDMQEQQADNLTKSLIKEECFGDIGKPFKDCNAISLPA